jgi:hypothetical protein
MEKIDSFLFDLLNTNVIQLHGAVVYLGTLKTILTYKGQLSWQLH